MRKRRAFCELPERRSRKWSRSLTARKDEDPVPAQCRRAKCIVLSWVGSWEGERTLTAPWGMPNRIETAVNKGGAGRGANGNSEPQPPVLQRHSNMQTVRLSKSECSTSADLRENDFKMRNTSLRTRRHDRISKKPKTKGLENSRGLWAGDKKNRFCKNFDPCAQSTHAGA